MKRLCQTAAVPAVLLLLAAAPEAAGGVGPAADPVGSGSTREEASALHQRALVGDETAVDRAIEFLESRLAREPDDALLRAYLGSAYTLKARDAAPWRKRRWVERGIETLDAAVERDPQDPEVRLVRAANAYNLPRAAGRYEIAAADFAFLLEALDERDASEPAFERSVTFHAGTFALRQGEPARAVALLEAAREVEGTEVLTEEIETMLRLARTRLPGAARAEP